MMSDKNQVLDKISSKKNRMCTGECTEILDLFTTVSVHYVAPHQQTYQKQTPHRRHRYTDTHSKHRCTHTSLAIIAIFAQHLGRHVIGRATRGVQQLRASTAITVGIANVQCTKAEIGDLQVAVGVEQQVLW